MFKFTLQEIIRILGLILVFGGIWLALNLKINTLEIRVNELEKDYNKTEIVLQEILKETRDINNRLIKLETKLNENEKSK